MMSFHSQAIDYTFESQHLKNKTMKTIERICEPIGLKYEDSPISAFLIDSS